jgi:hypothetical protein
MPSTREELIQVLINSMFSLGINEMGYMCATTAVACPN